MRRNDISSAIPANGELDKTLCMLHSIDDVDELNDSVFDARVPESGLTRSTICVAGY
jgi:hypothetical protein